MLILGLILITALATIIVWLIWKRAPGTYAQAVRLVLEFVGIMALLYLIAAREIAGLLP